LIRLVLNDEHLWGVLEEALGACRHRLFVATADVKDLHLPGPGVRPKSRGRSRSILDVLGELSDRGVEIHLLHGGVPSGPFLADLKRGRPRNLTMRRCVRVHAKAVIADGRWMYLGSANLTGAGLGAKSARRRNFEAGIVTDDLALIDPVADMLAEVFAGGQCPACGRKEHCPVPLEEPELWEKDRQRKTQN
jgi:phosphatidylserine/phosphatidylglycerophosphate/cardiolipin synthase-like enzyme